jgi:hypothetical protein
MNGGNLTPAAKISTISGGNVIITGGSVFPVVGTMLTCTGLVTMNGGTYFPEVNLNAPVNASLWTANQGFLLGGTATLTAQTVNPIPNPLPKGTTVTILSTPKINLITGDFATKNVAIPGGGAYNPGTDPTKQYYWLTV